MHKEITHKIAILMPGNLGCYKVSIDSIKENIVKPNNADVFILASKINHLTLVKNDFNGIRHPLPVDEIDIKIINDKFGNHLKSFKFIEDINDYNNQLDIKVNELQNRIAWFKAKSPFAQFYDIDKKILHNPKRYLDAFLRWHYLIKELENYETEHSIKYDFIIRMRIDQLLDEKIIISQQNLQRDFYWNRMDNFFFGKSKIMKYICLNFVNIVGSYDNDEFNESGDYRLTLEPQFREFIKFIICEKQIINLRASVKLFKENLCITLPNWKDTEKDRKIQGKSLEEYYQPKDLGVSFYPIYTDKYPYIWVYYLH